ncbi:MAG TPA: hypothetical protein VFR60_05935, partial [Sphingomicrobium sp.]|nr:hypothetical protein [Sphingomicrobium sp.]
MTDEPFKGRIIDDPVDAEPPGKGSGIDPFGEAQAHNEGFMRSFVTAQRGFFAQAVTIARDR